jgi:hypothetical protein
MKTLLILLVVLAATVSVNAAPLANQVPVRTVIIDYDYPAPTHPVCRPYQLWLRVRWFFLR